MEGRRRARPFLRFLCRPRSCETAGVARGSQEANRPGPRPNPSQGRRGVASAAEQRRSSQPPPGPDAQSLCWLAFLLVRGVRGRAGAGIGARGCAGTASEGDGHRAPPPPPPSPSGAQAQTPKVSEPRLCALAPPHPPERSRSAALVVKRSTLADWLLVPGQPGDGGGAPGCALVRPEQRLPRGTCTVAPRWVARARGRTSVVGDRASRASAHYSLEHRSRERLLCQAPCREGPLLAGQQEAGLHAARPGSQGEKAPRARTAGRQDAVGGHLAVAVEGMEWAGGPLGLAGRTGCWKEGELLLAEVEERLRERVRCSAGRSRRAGEAWRAFHARPFCVWRWGRGGAGERAWGGRGEGRQAGRPTSSSSSRRQQVRKDVLRRTEGLPGVGAGRRGRRSWRGGRLSGKPVAGGLLAGRFCQARGRPWLRRSRV